MHTTSNIFSSLFRSAVYQISILYLLIVCPTSFAEVAEPSVPDNVYSLQTLLQQTLQQDPDIQLAYERIREAHVRQQDQVKKRFLLLFNFVNAETLLGSAESDVLAAEAHAQGEVQISLLDSSLQTLNLLKLTLQDFLLADRLAVSDKQRLLAKQQFLAGQLSRYDLDVREGDRQRLVQEQEQNKLQITETQLKLLQKVTPANSQFQKPLIITISPLTAAELPEQFDLQPLPAETPERDWLTWLTTAKRQRPELQEFEYRKQSLEKLTRASKLSASQRPILMSNLHQLLLKQQKFERALASDIRLSLDNLTQVQNSLPTLNDQLAQLTLSLDKATKDRMAGYISQLDWQSVHLLWLNTKIQVLNAQLALQMYRLRLLYDTGELSPESLQLKAITYAHT